VKVRYRGLSKNKAQLHILFSMFNLWMVLCTLLQEMRQSVGRMWPQGSETGRN
jgi:hypothetical protein